MIDTGAALDETAAGVDTGAIHFVQIVEMAVMVTVETVRLVWTICIVPDVTVLVTGQVVTVVKTLRNSR